MSKIIKIHPAKKEKKKRVAAYCRVSTKFERQQRSLSTQMQVYQSRIQSTPDWEFAGIYVDNGRTGTNVDRQGYQELLKACQNGQIDLILTKSIKRFNRNTLDLLKTVRHLKTIGVGIYFELENINTMSVESEMILTFLGSMAQDEIRNMSENQKWSIRRKFAIGESPVHRDCYGYSWDGHRYRPKPNELEIVKRIFSEFLEGRSSYLIAKGLVKDCIPAMKGGAWTEGSVKSVLDNRSYTGCLLLQKTFTVDPITKKTKRNEGELDQFLIPDAHPAVIDEPTWEAVQRQKEINKRKHELDPSHAKGTTEFFKKVYCGVCGERMRKHGAYFRCEQTTSDCRMIQIKELKKAVSAALWRNGYQAEWLEEIEQIVINADSTATVFLENGETYRHYSKKVELTGFIHCGKCGAVYKVLRPGPKGRIFRSECEHQNYLNENDIKDLIASVLGLSEYDYLQMIDNMSHCTYGDGTIAFHFHDGRIERRNLNGTIGIQNSKKAY